MILVFIADKRLYFAPNGLSVFILDPNNKKIGYKVFQLWQH